MNANLTPNAPVAPRAERPLIGRVISVDGSTAKIELTHTGNHTPDTMRATVGKFVGILGNNSIIVGMVTEIAEQPRTAAGQPSTSAARMDLFGEIKTSGSGVAFSRGVSNYPAIGESAILMNDRELRLVYGGTAGGATIGTLHQDSSIAAQVNIDELLSKHFAILGTTGVGKSSGVAIVLQQILQSRPDLRIFLVDPHNEYGRCFGDKAQVLTPRNLRLPFWLFNFDETLEAFFGGRMRVEEEIEILSETIPLAKTAYLQYRNTSSDSKLYKRRDPKNSGYTVDTPVPYRIEDLVGLIDERMGKLENRSSRMHHYKLIQRIQTFRNHPRYAFMFENANVGGDTMAEIISSLFRLPANGKPMTVMQLAGFPAEVVDSVVSVLCRMAFDFGLWSDGVAPLLFVCEEAHRYAPADSVMGFAPTRRALSRIAKEGRKYGVFLGLVTQRPAEIEATIISQCNTLFVMRMSNDRDQSLIQSAVSDAATDLLTFVPSLGTGEVFVFGPGVALPTRMVFKQLPKELRPSSEVGRGSRIEGGADIGNDLIASVIDRWRSSTMSQKNLEESSYDSGMPLRDEAPSLQPQQSFGADQRSRLLKQPLGALGTIDPPKTFR